MPMEAATSPGKISSTDLRSSSVETIRAPERGAAGQEQADAGFGSGQLHQAHRPRLIGAEVVFQHEHVVAHRTCSRYPTPRASRPRMVFLHRLAKSGPRHVRVDLGG